MRRKGEPRTGSRAQSINQPESNRVGKGPGMIGKGHPKNGMIQKGGLKGAICKAGRSGIQDVQVGSVTSTGKPVVRREVRGLYNVRRREQAREQSKPRGGGPRRCTFACTDGWHRVGTGCRGRFPDSDEVTEAKCTSHVPGRGEDRTRGVLGNASNQAELERGYARGKEMPEAKKITRNRCRAEIRRKHVQSRREGTK